MSSIKHSAAANDEVHGSGAERPGEIVPGLLKHRVRPCCDVLAETGQYLARPRLDNTFPEALRPRHILHLEAPAGFGKSVAMAAAATRGRDRNSIRRIVLSERENDPARLLALLQFVFGKDETPDWPPAPGCLADRLSLLLEESPWQHAEQAGVLILDNLEEITSPGSLALIQQLAEELPAAMALGLCSRGVVRLETHRLELQNRYRRFGTQTLALSREEVRGFFEAQLRQNRMTSVAVENLYSLTEGWLTPLALYRRKIAQSVTPQWKIQETAAVQRFIRDTVLGSCTPARIRALRVMAEMNEISDELHLALVSPDVKAAGWLPSAASEAGIPLFALPAAGSWYRFNPLIPAVLSQTVLEGREHRYLNASRWYYRHGRFAEALRYALLSGDIEEVLSITSRDSEALLLGQDTGPLLDLRRKLPQWLLGKSARVRIVYAWVHSIGGQYRQAERLIGGLEPDTSLMASRLSALRAFILRGRGYTHAAIDEADRALASDELSTQAKLVSRLVKSSALCAAGRYSEARESNREASRLARESGDTGAEALAVYDHARIELGKGGLYHARQLLQTALDTALQEFSGPVRVGVTRLRLDLALILWHQGQVEQADQLLIDCIRETEQSRDLGLLLALVLRSVLARDQRRLEDAFTWIGQAERIMQAWQVDEDVYRPVMEALKASCWLARGQKESAWQALVRLRDFRDRQLSPELFPMLQRLIDFQEMRILLAAGDLDGAARCLNDLRRFKRVSLPMRVHMGLLEALLAWHRKAPRAKTRELLSAAIEEAASEHFVSPFADMIADLSEPMQKILPTLAVTDFTRHLASLFGIRLSRPDIPQLAEPISDREFAVLELIAGGLSNQAIADQLHISLHTVKTHARRINAKLEVKSRTQAIVRARGLGLLQG